jgi:hypothetical protein
LIFPKKTLKGQKFNAVFFQLLTKMSQIRESSLIVGIRNEIALVEAQIYELQTLVAERKVFLQKGNVFVPVYECNDLLRMKQQFVKYM